MRTLVVDDSAVARRFLRRFLGEAGHRDVTDAADAHEAARLVSADRFDLVLTCQSDVLKVARSLPAVLLLAANADDVAVGSTHAVLRKPFVAQALGLMIQQVVKRRGMLDQSSTDSMTGRIDEIGVPELIQFLTSCHLSGCLVVQAEEGRGVLHVRGGELIAATCDWLHGDEAVFRVATFENGMFRFRHETRRLPGNVSMPTMTLLIEAMRRRDEASA